MTTSKRYTAEFAVVTVHCNGVLGDDVYFGTEEECENYVKERPLERLEVLSNDFSLELLD